VNDILAIEWQPIHAMALLSYKVRDPKISGMSKLIPIEVQIQLDRILAGIMHRLPNVYHAVANIIKYLDPRLLLMIISMH
jgi:hypothetical protein